MSGSAADDLTGIQAQGHFSRVDASQLRVVDFFICSYFIFVCTHRYAVYADLYHSAYMNSHRLSERLGMDFTAAV